MAGASLSGSQPVSPSIKAELSGANPCSLVPEEKTFCLVSGSLRPLWWPILFWGESKVFGPSTLGRGGAGSEHTLKSFLGSQGEEASWAAPPQGGDLSPHVQQSQEPESSRFS